jgi:hypothetical protein
MLGEHTAADEQATVRYELAMRLDDRKSAALARDAFAALYQATPKYSYKKRIAALDKLG